MSPAMFLSSTICAGLGEIGVEIERRTGGAGGCLEPEQQECQARIGAGDLRLAVQRHPVVVERALPVEGERHGGGRKLGPAGYAGRRHAMGFQRELALLAAGRGEPVLRQVGKQQTEQRLRAVAGHRAVDVDLGRGKLGRLARGLGDERDVGARRLAAQLERRLGRRALARGGEADMDVQGRQALQMLGVGKAFRQAGKPAHHAEAVGGLGLKREVHLAGRRLAQALDPPFAVERKRAGRRKVETLDIESVALQREFGIELAGRDVRQQQLAHPQHHMHRVVAERREQVGRGFALVSCLRRGGGQPGAPGRVAPEQLAQVEAVAVERQVDGAFLPTAIAQRAGELGVAQLAAGMVEGERAVANDSVA